MFNEWCWLHSSFKLLVVSISRLFRCFGCVILSVDLDINFFQTNLILIVRLFFLLLPREWQRRKKCLQFILGLFNRNSVEARKNVMNQSKRITIHEKNSFLLYCLEKKCDAILASNSVYLSETFSRDGLLRRSMVLFIFFRISFESTTCNAIRKWHWFLPLH